MTAIAQLLAFCFLVQAARAAEPAIAVAPLSDRIVSAAREQIGVTLSYDPAYVVIPYPGGDVPIKTGVCSDVVVRALRRTGLDLQREIHEYMRQHFSSYPQKWGLRAPDKNIDHRRVPNLMRYFERHEAALNKNLKTADAYAPGDFVVWNLGRGVLHIGVVSDRRTGTTPLIIHNIGSGVREENVFASFEIIGHYRVKDASTPAARRSTTPRAASTSRASANPKI